MKVDTNNHAFPLVLELAHDPRSGAPLKTRVYRGLTKREHFAGLAMQGFCATLANCENVKFDVLAQDAVAMADALLAELAKGGDS